MSYSKEAQYMIHVMNNLWLANEGWINFSKDNFPDIPKEDIFGVWEELYEGGEGELRVLAELDVEDDYDDAYSWQGPLKDFLVSGIPEQIEASDEEWYVTHRFIWKNVPEVTESGLRAQVVRDAISWATASPFLKEHEDTLSNSTARLIDFLESKDEALNG